MEVDPCVVEQLHNQLTSDLENSDDSASDEEEDTFNWEWEAVSLKLTLNNYLQENKIIKTFSYTNRFQMLLVRKCKCHIQVQ